MSKILTFPTKAGINYPVEKTRSMTVKLSSGKAGIIETLRQMRLYVDQYKTSPQVRDLAGRLVNTLPQKDYLGEIKSLFNYVKDSIRYTRDIYGIETVQTPEYTLQNRWGDCDDKATLLAALLESIGFETRFHALGRTGGAICHVIVEVRNPASGLWLPLETTMNVTIGWLPPDIGSSIYYHGDGKVETINGLGKKLKKTVKKIAKPVKFIGKVTGTTALFKAMALPTVKNVKGAIHDPALQAGAVVGGSIAAASLLAPGAAGATGAAGGGLTATGAAGALKTGAEALQSAGSIKNAFEALKSGGDGGSGGQPSFTPVDTQSFTSKNSTAIIIAGVLGAIGLVAYLANSKRRRR